jgi:predicted NBD/HSP70 family sugar kinase
MLPQSPLFMAEDAGRALAHGRGTCPLVIDVGQTAVKLMLAGERGLFRRDWQALPAAESVPCIQPAHRQRLRSFVADAIRSFLQRTSARPPDVVVLALPCELDDQGVPGPCSYAGLEHDSEFADAVLAEAGLADLPCLLLNDAELAAVSARARWDSLLLPRTLVVTLGFGVGAALLVREPADG